MSDKFPKQIIETRDLSSESSNGKLVLDLSKVKKRFLKS